MSKRKRATLPRVTVLAYSKRDLAAFVQAVESLGLHVRDLQVVAQQLQQRANRSAAAVKANQTRAAAAPAKDGAP